MLKVLVKKKTNYVEQKEQLIKEILLKEYDITNYEISYTENGKPYIKGNEVYLSISHDEDLLLIVFDDKPVGVDIQFYRQINNNLKNVLLIDSDDPKEIIDNFSAKEAVIKLTGRRLCNINEINLSDYDIETINNLAYVINVAHYKSN